MLLRGIHIENLRSITELDWDFSEGQEAGWHVVLGNNGSGKSSLLRMLAATAMGDFRMYRLRQDFTRWVGREDGPCVCRIDIDDGGHQEVVLHRHPVGSRSRSGSGSGSGRGSGIGSGDGSGSGSGNAETLFSCGLGPYRQFGHSNYEGGIEGTVDSILARHLNLFGEQFVLRDCLAWLQDLKFRSLEAREAGDESGGDAGLLLERLSAFIGEHELLPYGTRLHSVNADAVTFADDQGLTLPVEELSDGYHSLLSIIFELVRRLAGHHGTRTIWSDETPRRIIAEGVVFIDEIDAHLHPSWQREIGWTLTRCFPRVQFIVTTHSPLCCQAAERGSIMRLPDPGEQALPRVVTGLERDRLLYGNVLDAYATPSFGQVPTRSRVGSAKLQRLAELNHKSLTAGLDDAELDERERLLQILPTGREPSNAAE